MTMTDAMLGRIRELERASLPLEPDDALRHRLREAVVDLSERYLRGLESARVYEEAGDGERGRLAQAMAADGIPLEEVVATLERDVVRPGAHPASAGHLAYLSGGGLYHAALADYLAAAVNKFAGLHFTGPGPVRMENAVVRWVADLVGYPREAGGKAAARKFLKSRSVRLCGCRRRASRKKAGSGRASSRCWSANRGKGLRRRFTA